MSSESNQVLQDNQFLFDNGIVTVKHFAKLLAEGEKHVFVYKPKDKIEVSGESIQAIYPVFYGKLYEAVSEFATKYDQIQKERQDTKEKAEKDIILQKLEEFKQHIQTIAPKELLERNPEFLDPQYLRSYNNVGVVKFYSKTSKKERVELSFQEKGKWKVEGNDYSHRSYLTLEKASARVIELLDSYETTEKVTSTRDQTIQAFATATGLVLKKGWHSYGDGRQQGYETYELHPQGAKEYYPPFVLRVSIPYDNKCSVTGVEIKEGSMTILGQSCANISFSLSKAISDPEAVKKLASDITQAIVKKVE